MVDGFGAITWWGFSPALDLQDKYQSLLSKLENLDISEDGARKQGKSTILIIGAGDCRHIFRTIAQAYRHTKKDLTIYVVEHSLEIYARHLLLLSIALEPKERLGLQEKTELFLELFGNSLVRPQASDFLQQKSTEFIRMVTDSDYLEACMPVFNFSQLKAVDMLTRTARGALNVTDLATGQENVPPPGIAHEALIAEPLSHQDIHTAPTDPLSEPTVNPVQSSNVFDDEVADIAQFKERDQLESIFKFWRNTDPKLFDICKHWEERLRQYFAVRYDSRQNIFDWDYNMKLSKKASIINAHEYKSWREQGVAFELRSDSTYEVSNRALASGIIIKKDGERTARRGYWGDIINSPYLAFGIESEEESLFTTSNGQYVKTATDVSEYNVTALMHEIMMGEKYVPPKIDEKQAKHGKATLHQVKEEEEDKEVQELKSAEEREVNDTKRQKQGYMRCPGITVTFLPLNCIPDLPRKSKYNKLFDVIYFSNSMVHLLTPEVKEIFADEAIVIVETTRFMLDLTPEQMQEYLKKITSMAQAAGCKTAGHADGEKDAHAFFTFQR